MKAAAEMLKLREVSPDVVDVKHWDSQLAPYLPAKTVDAHPGVVELAPEANEPAQSAPDQIAPPQNVPVVSDRAVETPRMLLAQTGLPAALEQQSARLDPDLFALVDENIAAARQQGQADLAVWLDGLAANVEGELAAR